MIDYTQATATNTPVQILYRTWRDALETIHGPYDPGVDVMHQSMFWGRDRNRGIGFQLEQGQTEPVIVFGPLYYTPSNVYGEVILTADGRLRLGYLHGWAQRSIVERNTFLRWSWEWGRYHWYYSPGGLGGQHYRDKALTFVGSANRRYVPEKLIARASWATIAHPGWAKMQPTSDDPDGWEIVHAADTIHDNGTVLVSAANYNRFYELRDKRIVRYQKAHDIETGVRDDKGRIIPTPEEREAEGRETAQKLSAHFQVSVPARTLPLRRNEQEGLWLPNGCL